MSVGLTLLFSMDGGAFFSPLLLSPWVEREEMETLLLCPPRLLESGRGKEVEVEDDTRGSGRLNGDGTFGEVKADDDQQILCPPHRCHHRLHVAR
uniref:Uncharacterized protein n=1 Tax=Oryza glumipatula TaxID=40148 RepID=A0A0D9ZNL4_9ORYZ